MRKVDFTVRDVIALRLGRIGDGGRSHVEGGGEDYEEERVDEEENAVDGGGEEQPVEVRTHVTAADLPPARLPKGLAATAALHHLVRHHYGHLLLQPRARPVVHAHDLRDKAHS